MVEEHEYPSSCDNCLFPDFCPGCEPPPEPQQQIARYGTVELECGCSYTPRHTTGDRKIVCDHGIRYVLSVLPRVEVHYSARRLKNQED